MNAWVAWRFVPVQRGWCWECQCDFLLQGQGWVDWARGRLFREGRTLILVKALRRFFEYIRQLWRHNGCELFFDWACFDALVVNIIRATGEIFLDRTRRLDAGIASGDLVLVQSRCALRGGRRAISNYALLLSDCDLFRFNGHLQRLKILWLLPVLQGLLRHLDLTACWV